MAEAEFQDLAGPVGATVVAVAGLAVAGYWTVDFAEDPTFVETLKALWRRKV